jgi:hypothetical protein
MFEIENPAGAATGRQKMTTLKGMLKSVAFTQATNL